MPLSQRALSQVAPGATHVPQLALQQTCPKLQVLGPQSALCDERLNAGVSGAPDALELIGGGCAPGSALVVAVEGASIGRGGGWFPPAPPPPLPESPALPPSPSLAVC